MTTSSEAGPDLRPDPRPNLFAAADQVVALVAAADPADVDRPTPCPDYDVRAMGGHLLAVMRRMVHVAGGGRADELTRMVTDVPDADLAAAAAADRDRLVAAWQGPDVLDRMMVLPWGTMPGRGAAFGYTQELTTHGWDLASALGRRSDLDPNLATAVLGLARQVVPAETRGGPIPFGPVVAVADDAGPYDQLVGWLGRDPKWSPA
jgi:uncharacterized protein (TIGR03086 family)